MNKKVRGLSPEMWRPKSKSFKFPLALGEVPEDHPARQFYVYWRELCGDRQYALKADFNPARVKQILPNIGVVKLDYSAAEFDLYLTLVGERIMEIAAINGKGSYRKDLFAGDELSDRLILYAEIAQNPAARFFQMNAPFEGREYIQIVKGMFPFSADGKLVDHIFLAIDSI